MMGYERWAVENNYGMRCPGTEGIFSAVKRNFGEHVAEHPVGFPDKLLYQKQLHPVLK